MSSIHAKATITGLVAGLLLAGCSGGSAVTPGPDAGPMSGASVSPGTRLLPGPAVMGPTVVPIVPKRVAAPRGWPAGKNSKLIFVANISANEVLMYSQGKNPKPVGSITDGLSDPAGLAVDNKGTLYVSNLGNNTITEYPAGSTSPSVTLSSGLSGNYGVAVDNKGDVFTVNLNTNTLVGFKPGKTQPFETVSGLDNPTGVAADSKNNVFVACDANNTVYEIPAGTSTLENSGLLALVGPIGLAFTKGDTLYVSNFGASNVAVYDKGSTSPDTTITNGITAPTLNAFAANGTFLQTNQGGAVPEYKKGKANPFTSITGISGPLGVTASPRSPN
jgi:hypothetical protein